jgi:hypothetical protein
MTDLLPLPNEALGFRFLIGDDAPGRALLEFDTPTDPVRVVLSQAQLDRLSSEAKITSVKLSWGSQAGEPK